MYNINDKSAAIMRVQRYLLAVGEQDEIYNPIDGAFGDQTKEALLSYQRARGLPVSGVADRQTFTALYEEYSTIADNAPLASDPFYSPTLEKEMRNEQVRRLNSLLNEYFVFSKDFPPLSVHDYYGIETEERVHYLRALWGMKDGNTADRAFLRRLSREVRGRQQYKNAQDGV